jgi:DNA-binding transcriptional LysR family regulator
MNNIHLSRIDLNLFVVFDAIYTEAGITRASKQLSLTQPAISHALGRLRDLFDDPLFLRQGKTRSTPLARVMIDPVRQSAAGIRGDTKSIASIRRLPQAFHGGYARRAS